jgi:hypothetical protein
MMFEKLIPLEKNEKQPTVNFAIALGLGEKYPAEFKGVTTSAAEFKDGKLIMYLKIYKESNQLADEAETSSDSVSYEAEFINGHWLINWELLSDEDKEYLREKTKAA